MAWAFLYTIWMTRGPMGRGLCGVWGEECHVLCPGLTCMDMWGLQGSDHNDVCHSARLLCYRIYKFVLDSHKGN